MAVLLPNELWRNEIFARLALSHDLVTLMRVRLTCVTFAQWFAPDRLTYPCLGDMGAWWQREEGQLLSMAVGIIEERVAWHRLPMYLERVAEFGGRDTRWSANRAFVEKNVLEHAHIPTSRRSIAIGMGLVRRGERLIFETFARGREWRHINHMPMLREALRLDLPWVVFYPLPVTNMTLSWETGAREIWAGADTPDVPLPLQCLNVLVQSALSAYDAMEEALAEEDPAKVEEETIFARRAWFRDARRGKFFGMANSVKLEQWLDEQLGACNRDLDRLRRQKRTAAIKRKREEDAAAAARDEPGSKRARVEIIDIDAASASDSDAESTSRDNTELQRVLAHSMTEQ